MREAAGPYRTAGTVAEEAAEQGTKRTTALEWLERQGQTEAFKGMTGAKLGDFRRLGKTAEEQVEKASRIGKRLEELAEAEGLGVFAPRKAYAAAVNKAANETGTELGQIRKTFDTAAARPSLLKVSSAFEDAMEAKGVTSRLFAREEMAPAEQFLERMLKTSGEHPEFTALHGYKRELDKMLTKEYERLAGTPAGRGAEALKSLRNVIDAELDSAGERAATELGKMGLIERHRLLNEKYADLAVAKKILAREQMAGEARLGIGLRDVGLGGVLSAVGGGPAALAGVVASKVGREYGSQIASAAIRKATKLREIQSAAETVDDLLSQGTKAFLEGKASTRAARAMSTEEVRSLRHAVSSNDAVMGRISQALGDTAKFAPKVAASASLTAMRAAAYMREALPKERRPMTTQLAPRPTQGLSGTELRTAAAIVETIEDPTVVVDRLRQGRLTQAHVDTLKRVHPETFIRVQSWIQNHAAELRPKLTVQEEVELSMLFEKPLNEALLPQNVKAFQQIFAPQKTPLQAPDQMRGSGRPPAGPPAGGNPIPLNRRDQAFYTAWDRRETGT